MPSPCRRPGAIRRPVSGVCMKLRATTDFEKVVPIRKAIRAKILMGSAGCEKGCRKCQPLRGRGHGRELNLHGTQICTAVCSITATGHCKSLQQTVWSLLSSAFCPSARLASSASTGPSQTGCKGCGKTGAFCFRALKALGCCNSWILFAALLEPVPAAIIVWEERVRNGTLRASKMGLHPVRVHGFG